MLSGEKQTVSPLPPLHVMSLLPAAVCASPHRAVIERYLWPNELYSNPIDTSKPNYCAVSDMTHKVSASYGGHDVTLASGGE